MVISYKKILFILKKREVYNSSVPSEISLSTGLYNSSSYVNDMLIEKGVSSNISVVFDGNSIEHEIVEYRPDVIIIEALIIVPEKIKQLQKLYPNIQWVIRLHSEVPFLAGEGIAIKWLGEYVKIPNVYIGVNSIRMQTGCETFIDDVDRIVYLPNYYPDHGFETKKFDISKDSIDIACFGAVRPLKNHLMQAIASLEFANSIQKKLHFHINGTRVEQKGENSLKNLIELFKHLDGSGNKLICHEWCPREEFLELCSTIDIGMQMSLSETYNIVSADLVSMGVPIVVTKGEIPWTSNIFTASATNHRSIVNSLCLTYLFPKINVYLNKRGLKKYSRDSRYVWLDFLRK